jgi:cardiolipin synthase
MMLLKKKYIPNYISVFRLLLIPLFLYFYFAQRNITRAVATFLIAGASDVVDGYLARHNNWISNLGRILDPVADKCMQATVLISLSIDDIIPWWISGILIGKEILMVLGATRLIKKFHTYAQSGWYGKGAVVIFYAIVVILMLADTLTETARTLLSCLIIVAMLFALIMYYFKIYRSKTNGDNK